MGSGLRRSMKNKFHPIYLAKLQRFAGEPHIKEFTQLPSHSVGNNRRVEDRWWFGGARRHLFKRRCRVDANDAYDAGTRTRREGGGKANPPDFQRAQKYLILLSVDDEVGQRAIKEKAPDLLRVEGCDKTKRKVAECLNPLMRPARLNRPLHPAK